MRGACLGTVGIVLAIGAVACASGDRAARRTPDAGVPRDGGGMTVDAPAPPVDAPAPPVDAGCGEFAGCDGGGPVDAGQDAGPMIPDSGPPCVPESCDGMDNDCDGTPDDGFECPLGATPAPCTSSCGVAGLAACDGTCRRAACVAPMEVCANGCDDDGDGMIDEMCTMGGVPNDTCMTAIDIGARGTYTGTTCGADDTVTLGVSIPCEVPTMAGTPDVFYWILPRAGGSTYRIQVTPGFAMQYMNSAPTTCGGNGGCGPFGGTGEFSISGGGPTMPWYFAIERSDGGCGPFTLVVDGM